jgi:hypothetical protein
MGGRSAILEPTHVQHSTRKIDLVPAQIGQFGRPQAMAVGDEDHCKIPMPPAVALGRIRGLGVKFHVLPPFFPLAQQAA